jgi:hypothetical protein
MQFSGDHRCVQFFRVACLRAWAALPHGLEYRSRCSRPWQTMFSVFGQVRSINEWLEKRVEPLFDDIQTLLSEESSDVSLEDVGLYDLRCNEATGSGPKILMETVCDRAVRKV